MKRPLAVLCLLFLSTALTAAEKPNLLFVIADDCTHHDIGCYGGQAHTPNIDKLASEGMRMKQCFQAAPMCSPTRHNIYTGIYPVKSGAYPNHTFVKDGVQSIVHYLQPLGYRVALSGKKHINPKEAFPFEYSGKQNNPDMNAIGKLFSECQKSETPFCLFACSNEPHSPWNKGDVSRYKAEELELPVYWVDTPATREAYTRYLAEITYYDDQVGQILNLLEEHKLADNTLVLVVSEQGNSFPFAKWTCYDAGIQSAMIARWPGKIEAGTTSDALVEYVDVTPTFIDAAGGTASEILDGKSMLPVFIGENDHHKDFVYAIHTSRGIHNGPDHFGRRSVRSDQFKLIHNVDPDASFQCMIDKDEYFQEWVANAEAGNEHAQRLLQRYHNPPEFELYNVKNDRFEMNNIIDEPQYAEVVKELKGELKSWMESQGDLGNETELAALEHMLGGNQMVKDYLQKKSQKKKGRKKQ